MWTDPIDVIHAHGTGTVLNDQLEFDAIDSVSEAFGTKPIVYSHKGMLGHSLGASGLVSIVLATEAHRVGQLPPMTTTTHPMRLVQGAYDRPVAGRPIRRSLILANGFGGPQTAVVLVDGFS